MLTMPPSADTDLPWDGAWPKIRLLGSMQADLANDRSFLPCNRKSRAVLAVLAIAGAKPVSRNLLIDLLWHTRGREQAQASLRQSVHELRSCLAPLQGAGLQSAGDRLTLRIEPNWIDVLFVQTPEFLPRHMLNVFRGPLLGDLAGLSDPFDTWILAERKSLAEKIRHKLERFLAGAPDDETMARIAEAIVSFDTSHEAAWRALASFHIARGNPSAALDVYHRCLTETRTRDGQLAFDVSAVLAQCLPATTLNASELQTIETGSAAPRPQHAFRSESRFAAPWRSAHLAMLPTRALGNATPEFAMCIDWQIQSALCKFEELSCIPVNPARVGEGALVHLAETGFDFMLEACIDRSADQDQFILRLRDLQMKGEIFWSQRICRPSSGATLFDADFATLLAPQIAAEISKYQAIFLEYCPALRRNVRELVLKASRSVQRLDRHSLAEAERLLSEATKRDDRHPALFAWSAYVQLLQLGQGWTSDVEATQRRVGELTDKALSLNPETASVLSIAGHVLAFNQNRLEEGLSLQEQALSRNPYLPSAWLFSGLAHTYAGEHKEAVSRLQRAKQLSPADQQAYFIDMGLSLSHLLDGDTGNALTASMNAIRLNPNFSSSFKVGVSASGYTDQGRGDARMLQRLLVLEPALTVERVLSRSPLTRREDQTRLSDGLRMAGLPR